MEIGLSTGSIQAWVAAQTDALYGDLKAEMNEGNRRNSMLDALNDFKTSLARVKDSAKDLKEAREKLEKMLDEYPELKDDLGKVLGELKTEENKYAGGDVQESVLDIWGQPMIDPNTNQPVVVTVHVDARDYDDGEKQTIGEYCAADGRWGSALQAAMDSVHEAGQSGLIEVQDLNSKLQQAQQMGSNMMATLNQTNLSIIANLK